MLMITIHNVVTSVANTLPVSQNKPVNIN